METVILGYLQRKFSILLKKLKAVSNAASKTLDQG